MEKMQYMGRYIYQKINPVTGEVLESKEVDEFQKDVPTEPQRPHGFMIAYLAEIINMMETLGNKKMKVVKYILAEMDKRNNTLIETTEEIAKGSGVSKKTVIETLKALEEANIAKRKTGAVMMSPRLMNNRTAGGEASMMITYKAFGAEKEAPQETPPTPAPEPPKEEKAA